MLSSVGQFLPLVHELLLWHSSAQTKTICQVIHKSLLSQHQRYVVDGGTIGNIDNLGAFI